MVVLNFFKILFIYLRERESTSRGIREKQAPCREPDAGPDPRTPGSRPGPKADAKPLSHPGAPTCRILGSTINEGSILKELTTHSRLEKSNQQD